MATPFMALTLPTPSVSTGPGWASTLNTAITTIDSHDHTSGKGVQVPITGLNVNADLPMTTGATNFNITGVRALRLVNLTATPTVATDINELVDSGGNLYWMNSSGQAVQITAGAALSATSLGGISGLPSGTASAAFASQTFTWRSATNTAATMDAGPLVIRDTALGALGITIASPTSLASAYGLTLPTAPPASTKLLTLASSGAMAFADVDNSTLQNSSGTLSVKSAGITRTQLASAGQQVSSSCGTFTTTSAAFVDVTNLTVTITTTGRPVVLLVQADGTANAAGMSISAPGVLFNVAFARAGSRIATYNMGSASSGVSATFPSASYLDTPGAGTYAYKIQVSSDGTRTTNINNLVLMAYEL